MMLYLEATSRIFQPTANFESFKIYLYFICQPASLPAIRPGCTRCRAPEISYNKGIMAVDLQNCYSEDDLPTVHSIGGEVSPTKEAFVTATLKLQRKHAKPAIKKKPLSWICLEPLLRMLRKQNVCQICVY